jgi:hypothetical protein
MKFLNIVSCLVICVGLSGCFGTMKTSETQIVKVPIATKCKPVTNITEITDYPFDNAKKEMSLYEKAQLQSAELKLVKGQNKELKAALAECTR